jgi:hypothetical protein
MTIGEDSAAVGRFGAVVAAIGEALDWPRLGLEYCEEGGLEFFCDEQREALVDAGLAFAEDLAELLAPGGRSLYVGAGVAELVQIVFEVVVLERTVTIASLPGFEVEELNRVLAEVGAKLGLELPRYTGMPLGELQAEADFDHVWAVSVLSDPDAFPALHDYLYERRTAEDGATGRGHYADDKARARELIDDVVGRFGEACLLSTSDEEWDLYGPAIGRAGRLVDMAARGRLSPIVGDVVRQAVVRRAESDG